MFASTEPLKSFPSTTAWPSPIVAQLSVTPGPPRIMSPSPTPHPNGYRSNAKTPTEQGFPRTFYYANAIELFERMAHYGFYIGLALYLSSFVKMTDVEVGLTLGTFRFIGSLAPIPCGALADRISFKRSLMIAFAGYATAYTTILFVPIKAVVVSALVLAALSGGFMKPVIMGTVIRTSPEGRQTDGFAIFYRMINTGSVVGKTIAYFVRWLVGIRFVATTSVIASLVSLGIASFLYEEPKDTARALGAAPEKPGLKELLRGYGTALKNLRFTSFLLIFAGYYFMIEQFYMTFPQYMTRHIDKEAPLEIITLINPAMIALGQGVVTQFMKRFQPVTTMIVGVVIGSLSMLTMGLVPSIAGACLSGAIFAVAEMTFSPRFYDFIGSFAPKGKAGMYMGLAFVPSAIGAWIGGQVSGPLIMRYLPKTGPREPLMIWSIYAGLGLACAGCMLVYRHLTARPLAIPDKP
jgi:POT family proton-dependent oligopeptide transporter